MRLAFVSALEVMGDEVPYQLTGFESLSTADVSEIVRYTKNVAIILLDIMIYCLNEQEGCEQRE